MVEALARFDIRDQLLGVDQPVDHGDTQLLPVHVQFHMADGSVSPQIGDTDGPQRILALVRQAVTHHRLGHTAGDAVDHRRAGAQGVGRIDLIEDRLVGIKSRELYEAPGAVALITAHQELENCCLEREQHRIKRDIDKRWAELVYDAQWFSPATQSLNAFIEDTQKYVSGEIRMVLHGGRAVVTGRRSDSSLYDYNLATYDSGDSFDQKSSNGFIDIYGLPSRVAAARDVKFGNGIEVPENSVE